MRDHQPSQTQPEKTGIIQYEIPNMMGFVFQRESRVCEQREGPKAWWLVGKECYFKKENKSLGRMNVIKER